EPPAVATLAQYLSYVCFGGKAYVEGRSYAAGRLGEQAAAETVSIVDDARAPDVVGWPFDYEGTPTTAVDLIRDGRLAGVVHDRASARAAGTTSTGHALPAPSTLGALPLTPRFVPGEGSIENLVAGLERGLLVTRFHYTNVVNPKETSLTGMTRDGTFLVTDGRVTRAVRNLRFTQSALGALAACEAVSGETGWGNELFGGGGRQPALRLASFAFTGTTSFG
ncbi:MAG: metallopeptidase TldD-related protein, partial [Egibacteraceae bacterium]